ncbi:MAG: 4-hydroxy-tetrahydrodipicolinate synthase [Actinomycetota bacterium]|nr:4-hydroxy-tetrahydrodipicolinate synthase [Actinomycetota bacterium]
MFTGVGVALVTLFDDGGNLLAQATAEHAARLVGLGVRAIVVAGTTGEAAALTTGERVALIQNVRAAIDGRVPLLAGTGAASTRQAVELTGQALEAGADAVLVLSPPNTTDALPYFVAVAKAAAGAPLLAYHYPAVSPPGIPVQALDTLPIDGLKDSSGEPERLLEELSFWGGHLYTGSSAILALAGPMGCAGAILALANVEPERCIAAFAGDTTAQRQLAPAHLAARRSFPRGIKQLTARRFGTAVHSRMG